MNFLGFRQYLVAVVLVLNACHDPLAQVKSRSAEALFVVPGGENVTTSALYDGTLEYDVDEPFPATQTLGFIKKIFEGNGWKPLEDDFLNPGLPSSHKRGWVDSLVGDDTVFSWAGQWTDAGGNVASYSLIYRTRNPSRERVKPSGPLRVTAFYLTAPVAKALREAPIP